MKKTLALSLIALVFIALSCQKPLAVGDKAPDFSLAGVNGRTVSRDDFLKGKEALLIFWASWCLECRKEVPQLNEFAQKYKDKVEIVGINFKESKETVIHFINAYKIKYKILLDSEGKTSKDYMIIGVPTHVLLTKDGLIKKRNLDIREMESYFRQE